MGLNPLDALSDVVTGATEKAERFVKDPLGETANTVLQPVKDAVTVFQGLTEGELRTHAAVRLGADAVSGMACGELIDWATDNP